MPQKKTRAGDRSVYDSVADSFNKFRRNLKENSKTIVESFIALFISVITAVSAGLLLGKYQEILLLLPGLIVLIPATLGMRGNLFAAMGSRLGSALHLGTLDKFSMKNTIVRDNVKANITLTIVMSVILGAMAELLSRALGIESIGLFSFVLISFVGGVLAGLLLLAITFGTAIISYRRGWDLDNIHAPLITALGDFVTIPFLLIAALIVQGVQIHFGYIFIVSIVVMAIAILNLFAALIAKPDKQGFSYKFIVIQSLPVL
ncbi:MAG: magnesium transporter, partial [Nanoarchaeota archaeon]